MVPRYLSPRIGSPTYGLASGRYYYWHYNTAATGGSAAVVRYYVVVLTDQERGTYSHKNILFFFFFYIKEMVAENVFSISYPRHNDTLLTPKNLYKFIKGKQKNRKNY